MKLFTVNLSTGCVTGPAEYLASERFSETKRRIEDGTHCLIGRAPIGTPLGALIEVILQTDYSAWLGQRQIERLRKGGRS